MTTTTAIHMLHNVPAPVRAIRETVRRSAKGIRETGPCNAIAHTEPSLRSFTSFTYSQRPKLFLLFATHTHPQTRSGTQNVLQTLEPQNSMISKTYKSSSLLLLFTTRFGCRSHKATNSSVDLQPKCPSPNPQIFQPIFCYSLFLSSSIDLENPQACFLCRSGTQMPLKPKYPKTQQSPNSINLLPVFLLSTSSNFVYQSQKPTNLVVSRSGTQMSFKP